MRRECGRVCVRECGRVCVRECGRVCVRVHGGCVEGKLRENDVLSSRFGVQVGVIERGSPRPAFAMGAGEGHVETGPRRSLRLFAKSLRIQQAQSSSQPSRLALHLAAARRPLRLRLRNSIFLVSATSRCRSETYELTTTHSRWKIIGSITRVDVDDGGQGCCGA